MWNYNIDWIRVSTIFIGMTRIKRIVIFLFLVNSWQLYAQMGLHTQFLFQQPSSILYQPANILRLDIDKFAIGGDGSVYLGNNSFRIDPILREGNRITEEIKDDILRQFNANNNQLHQGFHLGGYAIFNIGNTPISLSARRVRSTYLRINDPGTAGLILRGNAPFAGQEIADESLAYRSYEYWEGAVGSGWQIGRWLIGARLKSIIGTEAEILDRLSYNLFTESDGTNISVQSSYEFNDTQGDGIHGLGGGVDLGVSYLLSEKVFLQVALINAGFIRWNGRKREENVTFEYEGVPVDDLLGLGLSNNQLNIADTLQDLFFPVSEDASFTTPLPTSVSIGGAYQFTQEDRLIGSVTYGLTNYGPTTDLPLINVGYHRKFTKYFLLGINAYGGGMDLYGLGGLAACKVPLGSQSFIQIFYHLDNALGFVYAQGVSMNGGFAILY